MSSRAPSLINRICIGSLLLVVAACGGGGLDSNANRVSLRLERDGATTTTLEPGTTYTVRLRVTSLDAAMNFKVTFEQDPAHFETIAPVDVLVPKSSTPTDVDFQVTTKAVGTGELDMTIDAPSTLTTTPLAYTIAVP